MVLDNLCEALNQTESQELMDYIYNTQNFRGKMFEIFETGQFT